MTAWQTLSAKLQASDEEQAQEGGSQEGGSQEGGSQEGGSQEGGSQEGGPNGTDSQQESDPWEQASAPAQVARRVAKGVFHQELSPDLIPALTNAMHWAYGTSWGAVYGVIAGSTAGSGSPLRRGAAFGTAVWLAAYVQLVPMGLYEPPWKYAPKELGLDLSYHLVYGVGVAAAYGALDRR